MTTTQLQSSWTAATTKRLQDALHFARRVVWIRVVILIVLPIWALVQTIWTPLTWPTLVWALLYYNFTGVGITAGYHRLWAHTSYSATTPLRIFLALGGAGAMQGSIRWWSGRHRSHHRYTDTDKDPYSVKDGFFYAHMGWLLIKGDPKSLGRIAAHDLDSDPVVIWQHKNSNILSIIFGLIIPISVCGLLWNDWYGGFIYAGILRLSAVHQATFSVNSLAHWLGETPFEDRHTPRDHYITAFFTFGEGYHNFHHTFPSDYRNALEWYQFDPTKWLIRFWKYVGLAHDLKQFRASEVEKARLQQTQRTLETMQRDLDVKVKGMDWGIPLEGLPVMEWDDFIHASKVEKRQLVLIAGVVHDVEAFAAEHPGGKALVTASIGKDATASFNGGVYAHSKVAHNMLASMRVAVLRGGGEVEIWTAKGQDQAASTGQVQVAIQGQGQTVLIKAD